MLHCKHQGTSFWLVKRVWRALNNKLVKQRGIQIPISLLDHLQSTNGKDKDLVLCVVPHPNSFHIANSTLLLAMDNIAYNCMYRNIICNRLEEYTI